MIIHDVEEYIHWNLPYPQFYIQDILPKEGVMLVYGAPKVGKSWLTMELGFCISVGEDWLGFHTEQAKVLIAQFEISPIAYAWRLKHMAQHFQLQPRMFYEVSPGLLYLDDGQNLNGFAEAIRELHPNVIILDCLAVCFGGDENSSKDMAGWIENVNQLKVEHQASLVIVHHTNKNILSTSAVDKARGHSRLVGWVDTLVYMVEQPGGIQLQFKARQSTRELRNINIGFGDYLWHTR